MAYSPDKFNIPPKPSKQNPEAILRPEIMPSPEFIEREKPLTKNEGRIFDNIVGTSDWFNEELKDLNNKRLNPNTAKYVDDFERKPIPIERPAAEAEILEAAVKSDLVFFGDYHHLRKSQDFIADFVEQVSQKSDRPSVLAIEFVECSKAGQKALDDFMSREIDEEEFLKRIKFKNWDNPEHWLSYRHMLESARRSGVKVCGINTDRKEKNLGKTDEKIAINLQKIAQQNPGARIIIHIGEDHLSESHLPQKLAALDEFKQKKSTTIFQNLPSVYFNALKRYENFHIPKSFKLQSQHPTYNLITAPLITKLIADIEYLQLNEDRKDNVEFLTADTICELVKRIVDVLDLKKRKEYDEGVPSAYSLESEAEKELQNFKKRKIFKPYFKILDQKGSAYIPGSEDGKYSPALIIKRFRLKKVLEELAKFIAGPDKKVEDFKKLSPEEQKNLQAFQYLCSNVFIPERSPSNKEEEKGEKMFRDFLEGKKVGAPLA